MEREVFITKIASYFPNSPVENDEMEDFLGLIGGKPSRVRNIILRQNGIKRRYYALNKKQEITHTNAEMAGLAIKKMLPRDELRTVEVLSCGTSSPDQYLPSHASMVHGETFEHPLEIFSLAGVCMTGIAALKTSYMSVKSGNSQNAVCSTSELSSAALLSKSYEKEYEDIANVKLDDNEMLKSLTNQADAANDEVESLKEKLKTLEKEKIDIELNIKRHDENITNIENGLDAEKELADLERIDVSGKISELNNELDSLHTHLGTLLNDYTNLQGVQTDQAAKVDELKEKVRHHGEEEYNLRQQLYSLKEGTEE